MVPCGLFDKIHGHSWSDHEPTLRFIKNKINKENNIFFFDFLDFTQFICKF